MVFGQNKSFFLTLDAEAPSVELAIDEAPAQAAETSDDAAPEMSLTVAVAEELAQPAGQPSAPETAVAASKSEPAAGSLTTAEAISAELAAAEAARPVVTFSTYAPDRLMAGTGLPTRRRRPGASMKGFRGLASDLFKS